MPINAGAWNRWRRFTTKILTWSESWSAQRKNAATMRVSAGQIANYNHLRHKSQGGLRKMENPALDAFCEQLYRENFQYIRSLAGCRLNDKTLADEVVQLTFLTAFHNIQKLQADPAPLTWLLRTAMKIVIKCNGGASNA
jgi:hypothetical protein